MLLNISYNVDKKAFLNFITLVIYKLSNNKFNKLVLKVILNKLFYQNLTKNNF